MTMAAAAGELMLGYEALRSQAVGVIPGVVPRGLAVLRRAGMVAWMRALPPDAGDRRSDRPVGARGTVIADLGGELVSVLTEMALGAGRGTCHAS
jgi:hypothetical protein